MPAIVRNLTARPNCDRYLVVTRVRAEEPGAHLQLDGVGAYHRGLGSLIRHSHLLANFEINVLDTRTHENLNRAFAGVGARLSQSTPITEDPLNRLDDAQFREPPSSAAGSATCERPASWWQPGSTRRCLITSSSNERGSTPHRHDTAASPLAKVPSGHNLAGRLRLLIANAKGAAQHVVGATSVHPSLSCIANSRRTRDERATSPMKGLAS
jgi:hypothetical protein